MSGRTSGRNRVASEVGQAGQADAQYGNGGKTFTTVHDQPAQSSKSPARDYSGVNVTTLRTALRNRGLSMQDTKEELIERLRKSDEGSKLAGGTAHSGLTQDNALSHLDTESNSATTATERTPADSVVSQEVGDVNDPVGVEVAANSWKGRQSNCDGRFGSFQGEDEGQNGAAACTHSEVTVDGETEVPDAGELLLPQQVTSSAVVQVPPLKLAVLHPASPPTIRLATPTGSSHSSDKSAHEGTDHGAASVSTSNVSTNLQGHSGTGETSTSATPGARGLKFSWTLSGGLVG
jgi:hypothetical protein